MKASNIILLLMPAIITVLLSYNPTPASADRKIIIEDFSGNLFGRWLTRDASKKAAAGIYSIQNDGGNGYLHAQSYKSSIQIARKVKWNIRDYPVLTWRWRVSKLPANACENKKGRNDSAASVYVIIQKAEIPLLSWEYQPVNVIKYVWSATLPAGTIVRKSKEKLGKSYYDGRFIVLETGPSLKDRWVSEKRNVLKDYIRFFGKSPSFNPALIAILTDSNDTASSAAADYDDIIIRQD
jgi:hypothetical protein